MKNKLMIMLLSLFCLSGCNPTRKEIRQNISMLQDREWHLLAIQKDTINNPYQQLPFIVFHADGTFSGNSGCNLFFGSYYQKRLKLQLTYEGSTKRLCEDMFLEEEMLRNLKKDISHFAIQDSVLYLYAGKEEVLRFK